MKKRCLASIVGLFLCLLLTACAGPEASESEAEASLNDRRPMVMVDGQLYYDTNQESTRSRRCATPDGEIVSSVDAAAVPTTDDQSNFGTGYGYQYGPDDTIEVYINDQWMIFEPRNEEEGE